MITAAVISAVMSGLTAMLTLLPSLTFPSLTQPVAVLSGGIYEANSFFPIGAVALAVLGSFAIESGMRLWDFAVWIYHQFWGSD